MSNESASGVIFRRSTFPTGVPDENLVTYQGGCLGIHSRKSSTSAPGGVASTVDTASQNLISRAHLLQERPTRIFS
jgi:hypothetical protein